jgi:hypothetical protein
MKKPKIKKPRNKLAIAAQFRTSGGSMKDKRQKRGGTTNKQKEILDDDY